MRRVFPTLLLLTFLCTCASAQKAITVADMQAWNQIRGEQLSADGDHLLYSLVPDLGDPEVVVRNTKTLVETRFPRLHNANFSYDGKHLIGMLKPALADSRAIKLKDKAKAKKKLAKMDSLLVINLASGVRRIVPEVYSFKTGERWSDAYAYTTTSALPDSLRKGMDDDAHRLLVRNFNSTDSFYLEGVTAYELARDEPVLIAQQAKKDSSWEAGVLRLDTRELRWEALSAGEGDYGGLAISTDGDQVAFLTSDADSKDKQKPFHLHHWESGENKARMISEQPGNWLASGHRISDDRSPEFSENGKYLYFGTTPRRPEKDTTLLDTEVADVEVWTTEDPRLYTQRNVRLKQDAKQTYLAVYRTGSNNFLQIGTPELPYDYLPRHSNGPWVAVYDDRPYAKQTMWEGYPGARNTSVINLETGDRQEMENGQVTPARWLEGGKFLIWYNQTDTTWNSFDPSSGQAHVLTTNATGTFYDEINDRPMHPSSYRYAGTLEGGNQFLVYDRYDIWQLDPKGQASPHRITAGRERKTTFRLQDLDRENDFVDFDEPQLVSIFKEENYHSGFGWLDLKTGGVETLHSGAKSFGDFLKARKSKTYVYSRSDFREFPDLRITKDLAKEGAKITNANPQQKDFAWGTAEPYEWIDNQGRTLRGMLIKPDGFDPKKKYPMLVNFYERSSQGVYRHRTPVPGRSSINYSHYVSKGYVIFNPDVIYRVGYPGESAYDCVMSGVTSLLSKGFIDRERIGMQGHSWGGYQAAYLVTKTDMFAAVESGAPVVNMFSAYGGIRWGSGVSRQFQYEHTQSRIGGTPWTHFQRYYENSPLFTTDKINTPLLILHNDNDGAVPWYQGIEWFTALRRLGKPAWFLNYRGEPHWPVKTPNRADFQTRMAQFFDHYLMDAPMPVWMERGVSPMERGKEQNLETRE